MREEKIDDEFIHEDVLMSILDYYYSQFVPGNFAQLVHSSGWNSELNELIEEGLALIGAFNHLELFQQQSKKVKLMSSVKLNKFLKGKLEGASPSRDLLNDDSFYEIEENFVYFAVRGIQIYTLLLTFENYERNKNNFLGSLSRLVLCCYGNSNTCDVSVFGVIYFD